MSKSNKYKIYYKINFFNNQYRWYIYIKKLKIKFIYQPNKYIIFEDFYHDLTKYNKILNNFLIEPTLINMLTSEDLLIRQVGFQILNNRLNERTK